MRRDLYFALFALLLASVGCIIPEGNFADEQLPTVEFDVMSNPPDCLNSTEMTRDFNRVVCEWDCAQYKGSEGRNVKITFEPKGEYVDQDIRSWHIASEESDESYSWECPDWFNDDGSEY